MHDVQGNRPIVARLSLECSGFVARPPARPPGRRQSLDPGASRADNGATMPPRTLPPAVPGRHPAIWQRQEAQGLAIPGFSRPEDVVGWFGAVQAQEYGPARWALGLRLQGEPADAAVASAFDEGRLLRTHVLRPTWHFVTPADLRWMLALTGPRIQRTMAPYDRRLEIDAPTLKKARRVFEQTLTATPHRTRAELAGALAAKGIAAGGQRLAHLVMHAELEAVICSGPRRGRQFTYALVDQRAPGALRLDADQALETLVVRFFRSHGPATARDFAWWSGLRISDATRVLGHLRAPSIEIDGLRYWWIESGVAATAARPLVHLLPIYDEYAVAYRDRVLVPHGAPSAAAGPVRSVVFQHALVIDGQIAGTWRVAAGAKAPAVDVHPHRRVTAAERAGSGAAAARYERFVGVPVRLRIAGAR